MTYEKFDLLRDARLAHNYLTRMVDARHDFLPYWLIGANENPAWAKHCRVDDAELVASWYEALDGVLAILGPDAVGRKVLAGFQKHLLRSWGEQGLRFHEPYPWSNTLHSSFHEMAYVLSALNRWRVREPDRRIVEKRRRELVRGMRGLVHHRKVRTFWSGDFAFEEPVYEFPNDIWIQGKGWDFTRVTGRGEEAIRNGMMLHALVESYRLFGDEVALDLATGLANHLLGISRYFNWKGEFFGHVHSAVWVACGLVQLGRLAAKPFYVKRGRDIFHYVLGQSSAFGWVPEYAQWHPMGEEHCETCCIKDMIYCAFELIDAGYPEYWDVVNRFVRNQLSEQQVKDGRFIGVDNTRPDTVDTTFRDLDRRIVGGWSGGGEPNSISLRRFRSVAGCCVGTAPQALERVWERIVESSGRRIAVQLPIDKDDARAAVSTGYPNEGWLQVKAKKAGDYAVRVLPFMERGLLVSLDGVRRPAWVQDGRLEFAGLRRGQTIRLEHDLRDETRAECARDREYQVTWRGSDVVDMTPHGEPLRLYQRRADLPKEIPPPPPRKEGVPSALDARPTEQKR